MRRQVTNWERIFANDIPDKEMLSTIYKELLKLSNAKMNNPLKNGQDTWTDTSPEKICTSWITIWKVAQHHVKGQKMRKGICKLKWDTTAHQLEWPNPKQWQNLKGARMWTNRNSYLLLVQMQNWTGTLEDSWAVSHKMKHTLTIQYSKFTPRYLPKWVESTYLCKNLHRNINGSFIHNCWNLEATKCPSVGEWVSKLWYL